MSSSKRANPFYVLLIPVGLAFVVTCFAYGFMGFQAVNGGTAPSWARHPLTGWLRAYGDWALVAELVGLAILTVAAMAFDSYTANEDRVTRQFDLPPAEPRN